MEAVGLLCVYTLRGAIIKLENVTSFLEITCTVMEEHSGLLNVAASGKMIADSLFVTEWNSLHWNKDT